MKPGSILGALLLASVAAFSVAATAVPAGAQPSHCPPGLAKKGSCVPPGLRRQAPVVVQPAPVIVQPAPVIVQPAPVVVYTPGDYVPHTVVYRRVYYHEYNLPRPQSGHFYARIGGDIYLLAEATQRVIEAINLVDAATR
jgi:hypothetical protein